jgi:membrane protease YdiL (CAAX protease family)
MGLDIRWPIGLMFSLIGALLTGYGALTSSNADLYKRSLDININLCWGLVLLVFGGLMLLFAWRGTTAPSQPPASDKP